MPPSSNDRSKPDSVTLNKDQVILLAEVLQRVQPANLLPPEDWNEIANLTGATNSKAVKERLRYLTCALSGLSTKPSRAKGKAPISAPASPATKPAPASKAIKSASMKRGSHVEPLDTTHQPLLKRRKTSTAIQPTIPESRNTKNPSGLAEVDRDEEEGEEDNYATEEGVLSAEDRVVAGSWDFSDTAYNLPGDTWLTAPVLRLPGYPAMDDIGLDLGLLSANAQNNFGSLVEDAQFGDRSDQWLP